MAATPEPAKKKSLAHSTALIAVAMQNGTTDLFHSPDGEPYATVNVGTHRETLGLTSRAMRQYLSREFYVLKNSAPSKSALADAMTALCGSAMFHGPERRVYSRVAAIDGAVWLDLGGPRWDAVKVTSDGWEIIATPDVRFVRRKGMLALPTPVRGTESLDDLLKRFLNVSDDRDLRLVAAWMVGALRGRKPYPVLAISGEYGSAKSSACRFSRSVIDPNQAPLSLPPKEARDLMIASFNSHVIGFDNLSFIPDWLSDSLAALATGAGFRTRALTTDDEEVIFNAARPIVLNGISDVVRRGDLLDRTLVVELDAIPAEERRTERDIDAAFAEAHPAILAALLDAVSCAIRNENTVKLLRLPRMADFAVTIAAAEPALGWEAGSFMEIYDANRQTNVEKLLEGNPIVTALRKLATPWEGTAGELRDQLTTETNKEMPGWPKSAQGMTSALRRLAPDLRNAGINVRLPKGQDRSGEHRGKRVIRISADEGATRISEEVVERTEDLPF